MKTYSRLRALLVAVILVVCGTVSRAQMVQVYYQGFENGETPLYDASSADLVTRTNFYHFWGSQALSMQQPQGTQQEDSVYFILGTLDFSTADRADLSEIALEFDHICNVDTNSVTGRNNICCLWYRLVKDVTPEGVGKWRSMNNSFYNQTEGGTSAFGRFNSFSRSSYSDWRGGVTNNSWKHERFDLKRAFANVPLEDRKLLVMFSVAKKTTNGGSAGCWYFDNIKVTASTHPMAKPNISMALYPDGGAFPSSRGARIMLDATSGMGVNMGIDPNNVHVFYKMGDDPTVHDVAMSRVGQTDRYVGRLPFEGYYLPIHFYCQVADLTSNPNVATFPSDSGAWVTYWHVRGNTHPQGIANTPVLGTAREPSPFFPFTYYASNKTEWVYDSALMAQAGYKAGAFISMECLARATGTHHRDRVQIRMKNAPTNYYNYDPSRTTRQLFNASYMQVVYDSAMDFVQGADFTPMRIRLQDTFYYAGKDLVIQLINQNSDDVVPVEVMCLTRPNSTGLSKKTLFMFSEREYGVDALTDPTFNESYAEYLDYPAFALITDTVAMAPLNYDLGVSQLVAPNSHTHMEGRPAAIKVKLKNYGTDVVNGVRIYYSIYKADGDSVSGHYDWSGSLQPGREQEATLSRTVSLPAGVYGWRAWTGDSVTVNGQRYADYEPMNNSCPLWTRDSISFVVCDGPMHGVRRVGGTSPDFATIEDFLFAVNQCGVDDSLVVKIAPGRWPAFNMPSVPGVSARNYIVFEPQSGGDVVFYADSSTLERVVYLPDTIWGQNWVVNLNNVSHVRFRNITFTRHDVAIPSMVSLSMATQDCRFYNCRFIDSLVNPMTNQRMEALINSKYANGLVVEGCTFEGGNVGVNLEGVGRSSSELSTGAVVRGSLFRNQFQSAVAASKQYGAVIEGNQMYDVTSGSHSVIEMYMCYGASRIVGNKIYSSHGAGCVGVSQVESTMTEPALVANNMIVCENEDYMGLMKSPIEVDQSNWVDVVFNSVKLNAPYRNEIAAARFENMNNSNFLNNILVCEDGRNYALHFDPRESTSNQVGHNIYYTTGEILNFYGQIPCVDLAAWSTVLPSDNASVSFDPNYLNGSLVDLRTFKAEVRALAVPIASVTTDMFGTPRDATAPCPGAFEFESPDFDFEPLALVNPQTDCYMPEQSELVVTLRNNGLQNYTANTLRLYYQVNEGQAQYVNVNVPVNSNSTAVFHSGVMLSTPTNGSFDSTYSITLWTDFSHAGANLLDPNSTNDTNTFVVVSQAHPSRPNDVVAQVTYNTAATFAPVDGIDQWVVYDAPDAPTEPSKIYWYRDTNDAHYVAEGPTFTTEILHDSTSIYFRQSRELPIVRITQVEMSHGANALGLTSPMPYWMQSSRKAVLQITNVGDATANLAGDTLQTISGRTPQINNKIYVFPDINLAPGESIVVQYATGNPANPSVSVHTGITPSISATSKVAFVLRHGGEIVDAVMFGELSSYSPSSQQQAVRWATIDVPEWVWSGEGITSLTNASSGVVRTAFNGNASDWELATAEHPMFLGSVDPAWRRYASNGCEGHFAKATAYMVNHPSAEIAVENPQLFEDGCHSEPMPVVVKVHNYGLQMVNSVEMHYTTGVDTVSETFSTLIPEHGEATLTFSEPITLGFSTDTSLTVRVWCDSVDDDPIRDNDTAQSSVVLYFVPAMPDSIEDRHVKYSYRDTISLDTLPGFVPIWYNTAMMPVDTGYYHITDPFYFDGTVGVSYLKSNVYSGQVGYGTSVNSQTSYPCPYQPKSSFAKQQYIYSAADLRAQGLAAGYITNVSFFLNTIVGSREYIRYNNYKISMGLTPDTIFSSNSDWKSAPTLVFNQTNYDVRADQAGSWVDHQLDAPFYWDGVSSVVVQVTHRITPAVTSGVKCNYTAKTATTLHKDNSSALSPSTEGYVGTGSKGNNRPNIKFSVLRYDGCESPVRPYNVIVDSIPSTDVALQLPERRLDTIDGCDGPVPVNVTLNNMGRDGVFYMKLYYWFDNNISSRDSLTVTDPLPSAMIRDVTLTTREFTPGRHTFTVVVKAPDDIVAGNDTLSSSFLVRFCEGNYTIAPTNGDFASFSEAADTLMVAGITGPVTFLVAPVGEYLDQAAIGKVWGSSPTNTITFRGLGDGVKMKGAPTNERNYVMKLDSTSYIRFERINFISNPIATAATTPGNVLVMRDVNDVKVERCRIEVKEGLSSEAAKCVALSGTVNGLVMQHDSLLNGYYSISGVSTGNGQSFRSITLQNNVMQNFQSMGLNLRGVVGLTIFKNTIQSGVTVTAARSLRGISLDNVSGTVTLSKNKVMLIDENTGGKIGMYLKKLRGTPGNAISVSNNMISCSGTGSSGLSGGLLPSGIWIDSNSSNMNIYYNSIRLYCGASSPNSRAFYAASSSTSLSVMNNIFSNFSKGYAYYVPNGSSISVSDHNDYYSEGANIFGWGTTGTGSAIANYGSLQDLQRANRLDANSVLIMPDFESVRDLRLRTIELSGRAQYINAVPDDIYDSPRSRVYTTIGAFEVTPCDHDMVLVRILEPKMPANINNPTNIEGDTIHVVAEVYNNSFTYESGVSVIAKLASDPDPENEVFQSLGNFEPRQRSIVEFDIIPPMAAYAIDTQAIIVRIYPNGEECTLSNNTDSASMYIAPAYNVTATRVETVGTPGCEMRSTQLRIQVKNVGFKEIAQGQPIDIWYRAELVSPANVNVLTLPTLDSTETQHLPTALRRNQSTWINFTLPANLYPTDNLVDIKVKLTGGCSYERDWKKDNDNTDPNAPTQSPVINSFYTPNPPVALFDEVDYASNAPLEVSQDQQLVVRWYRDNTSNRFFYPGSDQVNNTPTNYTNSSVWNPTDFYFDDSIYYFRCYSSDANRNPQCPSQYSSATVHVRPLVDTNMAFVRMLDPYGGRVYMENDIVRVVVANRGFQPLSNIPVVYILKKGNQVVDTVTEYITDIISPGTEYEYTFDSLLRITTPTTNQNYSLQFYVDMPGDKVRHNDTMFVDRNFRSLAESTYPRPEEASGLTYDITRISFNGIDLEIPPVGRGYTEMATYPTRNNPLYPVLHVMRGERDSLILQVTSLSTPTPGARVRTSVYIDANRNGVFEASENLTAGAWFYLESTFRSLISVPDDASDGYMRMRVVTCDFEESITSTIGVNSHIMDFMLYVDPHPAENDLAVTQIVSPRDFTVSSEEPVVISFRVANKGTRDIYGVGLHYSFNGVETGVVDYSNVIPAGNSVVVSLPAHSFPFGLSTLKIWHDLEGDQNHANDTLTYEYYRFYVVTPTVFDDFEGDISKWYSPAGRNSFSRSIWERGVPSKTRISASYSESIAWVTDLVNRVSANTVANVSYLYGPIVNISMIRPDTISFQLQRNLTNGSRLWLEYKDVSGKWVKVDCDTIRHNDWYNDSANAIFNGTSPGSAYKRYWFPTRTISRDFGESVQFRFVYTTPAINSTGQDFGEGCSIDDFRIGRARRNVDAGIIAIVEPANPSYGETVIPKVLLKNFGNDTLRTVDIGYIQYGRQLATMKNNFHPNLPPDGVMEVSFDEAPFVVTSNYPTSLSITAFTTHPLDIYLDNNTCVKDFNLAPLENDILAESFLLPLSRAVAGDSVIVTMRIRNFGQSPIHNATASYLVNDRLVSREELVFDSLIHRPLDSMEYYHYTFRKKYGAVMGNMRFVGAIVNDHNDYIYNDTIKMNVVGVRDVTDLAARSVVVDTTDFGGVRVAMKIDNIGGLGVNNFEVGFYYDNDTNTKQIETYSGAEPIASLESAYYQFNTVLPLRPNHPYSQVTAFVHVDNDNDPTNDYTDNIVPRFFDIEAERIIVVENAKPKCAVYLEVNNIGNVAHTSDAYFKVEAKVNGKDMTAKVQRPLMPCERYNIFIDSIPKDPFSFYEGDPSNFATFTMVRDTILKNNTTKLVVRINYIEVDVPTVQSSELVLMQNYPNPFRGTTTIPFSLPNSADVRLFVVDALGHIVYSNERFYMAGEQSVTIDLGHLPSGAYYYGIEVDGQRQMRKMIMR